MAGGVDVELAAGVDVLVEVDHPLVVEQAAAEQTEIAGSTPAHRMWLRRSS
jgi:hypothetical protein